MSSKKQPESPTYIVDQDLGSGFYEVLRNSGCCNVLLFTDRWEDGTPDPIWIPLTARESLVVLTHDKKIRTQHRDIVIREGARIISVGGAHKPAEVAKWIVASWARIERFVRKHDAPYFARFTMPTPKEIEKKVRPMGQIKKQQ